MVCGYFILPEVRGHVYFLLLFSFCERYCTLSIVALSDRKGIDEWFLEHDECAERESKIQQYIGIPISLPKLGVIFLLQIDTPVPKLFGKNEEEIKEFAKVGIYPYAQFLYMAYEQSRATQALIERSNDDDDKKNLSFR